MSSAGTPPAPAATRPATATSDTVYYEHMGHRIGYTVLDGKAVGLPERGERVVRNGLEIQLYHEGEKSVAVFERNGRTCVLAGKVLADEHAHQVGVVARVQPDERVRLPRV